MTLTPYWQSSDGARLCAHCGASLIRKPLEQRLHFEKRKTCGYACAQALSARPREAPEARFWAKVNKNGPEVRRGLGQCWIWTAAKDRNGYGSFGPNSVHAGGSVLAHRFSLALAIGRPLGDGMHALHRCDNPSCVRPDHLWEGTHADNMADASAKGRFADREARKRGAA